MEYLDKPDLTTEEKELANSTYEELRRAMIAEDLRNRPPSAQPTLSSSILLITAALLAAYQCQHDPQGSSVERAPIEARMGETALTK